MSSLKVRYGRNWLLISMGCLMLSLLLGCGSDPTPTPPPTATPVPVATATPVPTPTPSPLDELIAAAVEEGELNVLGSGDWHSAAFISEVQDAVNAKYGINIAINTSPGPSGSQLLPTLISEYEAGRPASTDLFTGASARQGLGLHQAGAAELVDWKAYAPYLTDVEIGPEGCCVVVGGTIHGMGYNKDLISEDELPVVFDDFANPKYSGMIATTPYAVGWIEASIVLGNEQALDTIRTMTSNGAIAGLIGCGQEERVATGEFAFMAFSCGQISWDRLAEKGANVAYTTLGEFVSGTAVDATIPKNSEHPNLAKLVAVFLTTDEGQDIIERHSGTPSRFRPNTFTANEIARLEAEGATVYYGTHENVEKYFENYTSFAFGQIVPLLRGQ